MQKAFNDIIERLEELKSDKGFGGTIQTMYADAKLNDAIKIVNQVAQTYEQEVCEWKGVHVLRQYDSDCGQKSIVNPTWVYCPYCGKKIKIIQ